jgi:hypothetical protein
MHKNLALTAIAATLIGCAPARADPTQNSCWIGGENDNIKISGTFIMRHKRLSIKLDVPHCMGKGEKPQTYLHVEGSLVPRIIDPRNGV